MAPASTGNDRRSKIAVIIKDQEKSVIWSHSIPVERTFIRVLIKFIAPNKEEIPAKCKEKIVKSTADPA